MPRRLHGVHVPHRKHTALTAETMPPPKQVILPMSMHIGAPATPCVTVGDHVDVGQPVGLASGRVSAAVHASVSGTVRALRDLLQSNGRTCTCVIIDADGEQTPWAELKIPVIETAADLEKAAADCGLCGLGGAGFPTAVKLAADVAGRAEYLVVNGAECEPYITSDSYTMTARTEEMRVGIELVCKCLGVGKVIVGIEKNKPAAIAACKAAGLTVKALPPVYPQGGEKVLIYHTTGRTVPEGKLPIDVGCVVLNCTTLAELGRFAATGMPLTHKCVTVDGGAVAQPQNVIVPVGTPIKDLIAFTGGYACDPGKLLYGGPMMGVAVPSDEAPVLKNTNAVLALTAAEAAVPPTTACIRCGACINHCPMRLDPTVFSKAYAQNDGQTLTDAKVNLCIECGCCSFVCPARQPLVQRNRLAKTLQREYLAKKEGQP